MRKIVLTVFMVICTALIATGVLASDLHQALTTCPDSISPSTHMRDLQAIPGSCDPDGVQSSGAIYRICMPDSESWNGDLVIFAHGFIPDHMPLHIPEDQLILEDGTYIPERFNNLGYAFATTSYSTNGLAIKEGINDVCELVDIFSREYRQPRFIYLTGASEGALITVLALEQHPEIFDGSLAICGMIGDYQKHTDYIFDFRVVFDYFFPDLIPGSAIVIPQEVIDNWPTVYIPKIIEALRANQSAIRQLIRVTDLPFDRKDSVSIVKSVISLLSINITSTNDRIEKMGGQPFDNAHRYYHGSDNDLLLNKRVARFIADQKATDEIERNYQTSGQLIRPLITLHNTKDPLVPCWQEALYCVKTLKEDTYDQHVNLPVFRYGHCEVTVDELQKAFDFLVSKVNN